MAFSPARLRSPNAASRAGSGTSLFWGLAKEPFAVDELAADEPGERAALEDLDVRGRRIVLGMVFAVLLDPGTHGVIRAQAGDAFAVEEDGLVHQPPAAAYATAPLAASAACAAARRASGTR